MCGGGGGVGCVFVWVGWGGGGECVCVWGGGRPAASKAGVFLFIARQSIQRMLIDDRMIDDIRRTVILDR